MSLQTDDSGGSGMSASSDALGDRFYPVYDRLFGEDNEFVADIEAKLAQARMSDTVELYLSRAIGIGFISGLSLWLVGLMLGYGIFAIGLLSNEALIGIPVGHGLLLSIIELLRVPAVVFFTGLVFGSIGFAIGFGSMVAIPYSRASARKREINMLMTDSVSFMYALSVGGLNQLEIIEAMAQADDTYGEVAKEFQSIVKETEYFDIDYRTAIRKQALQTPSDDLSQFLTDMLSIVNSGGDIESFLEDKKEKHMRTAKQEQELTLETLELFGEMYMTLSLFPLLLIIIMVVMKMIPNANVTDQMLYMVVYGLIPMIGVGFLVLVSTVKHDEPGDGYLSMGNTSQRTETGQKGGLLSLGLVEQFTGEHSIFDRVKNREGTYETLEVLRKPHLFFRDNPLVTLALTVPLVLVIVVTAMVSGAAPTSWQGMLDRPIWGRSSTSISPLHHGDPALDLPRVERSTPQLRRQQALGGPAKALEFERYRVDPARVAQVRLRYHERETRSRVRDDAYEGQLRDEPEGGAHRVQQQVPHSATRQDDSTDHRGPGSVESDLGRAPDGCDCEREPRRYRTRTEVPDPHADRDHHHDVHDGARGDRHPQDAVHRHDGGTQRRRWRCRSQLQRWRGSGMEGANLSENIDVDMLSVLFFHAVTLQAIISGFICGYIRDADLLSGLKYAIGLSSIALIGWMLVA